MSNRLWERPRLPGNTRSPRCDVIRYGGVGLWDRQRFCAGGALPESGYRLNPSSWSWSSFSDAAVGRFLATYRDLGILRQTSFCYGWCRSGRRASKRSTLWGRQVQRVAGRQPVPITPAFRYQSEADVSGHGWRRDRANAAQTFGYQPIAQARFPTNQNRQTTPVAL